MATQPRPHSTYLAAAVALFRWLPLLGIGGLVGFVFRWQATMAMVILGILFLMQIQAEQRRQRTGERRTNAATARAMLLTTLVGGAAGGFLLGFSGAVFGAMVGFSVVLGQIPLSVKDEHGVLREFDPANPVQSARFYKQVKYLVLGSVAACATGVTVLTIILVVRSG